MKHSLYEGIIKNRVHRMFNYWYNRYVEKHPDYADVPKPTYWCYPVLFRIMIFHLNQAEHHREFAKFMIPRIWPRCWMSVTISN